jgi:hypothetical protein
MPFIKKRTGSFTVWLAEPFADSPLKDALADGLCSLEKTYTLDKVPASKSADVYKFSSAAGKFYFKQYHYRSFWDIIKHAFRPSRAKRTIKAAAMLETNGFASPEIVAMGYRRKGLFCFESFLLTREVENALPLYVFFGRHYGLRQNAEDRRQRTEDKREFVKALGLFVGRLHAKNISHGDLRFGNVLVRNRQSEWDFFLLDNERTLQYAHLPNRLRLKNLVQADMIITPGVTRTDRLRFLKAYLSFNQSLAPTWKQLATKVHLKAVHRLAKRLG